MTGLMSLVFGLYVILCAFGIAYLARFLFKRGDDR